METRYYGIIKTELVTPDVLKQVAMSPEPENRTVDQLRKTVDGTYCLIKSREPIVGVLIIDPDIELAKPEWNPVEADLNGDGTVSGEELSIWQKIVNWFK